MEGLEEAIVLKRTSTAQQVADGLTDMILAGKVRPGEALKESAIAHRLGVARGTVREAVRILERGGLVRRGEMHRGAVVIEPSDEELRELYRARASLELAGVRATTADTVAAVREAFQALEAASADYELHSFVNADLRFHAALVRQLQSHRIDEFYGQIASELRFFWMIQSAADREFENCGELVDDHSLVLDALERGDVAEAEVALSSLIAANYDRTCAALTTWQRAGNA